MTLYRLHYAWSTGGASSSEIDYYEGDKGEEHLKYDLLNHHLDIQYETRGREWLKFVLAGAWRRVRGLEEKPRRTTRIIKCEKMVNDEWVPVDYEFIEPEVILD